MIGLAAVLSTAMGTVIAPARRPEEYNVLRAHLGSYGHVSNDANNIVSYNNPAKNVRRVFDGINKEKSKNDASSLIFDLRRRSGLTIKQIAYVLEVSTKTIHNWQNGDIISSANMENLGRVLDAVRFSDRGEGALTRTMILTSGGGDGILLEMLKNKRFTEFRALAGQGPGRVDSKKFLMVGKPSESAGAQLQSLAEGKEYVEIEEKFNFRKTEFDLEDDDWV